MLLTGDYHTHTVYSHGKGTVLENAMQAKALGLKEIAITDHGFEQLAFGIKHKKMPSLIRDVKEATEKTGVQVYVGIEANLCGENGRTDLKSEDYKDFDVFLMGIHRFVKFNNFKSWYNLFWSNYIHTALPVKPPKKLVDYNTRAYINMIKKNPVDIVSHLNYVCPADAAEVAKCAADYGTYIELNSKKVHLTDEELFAVVETGVRFVVDSDAHSVDRVGDTKLVEEQLARVHVPPERIDNIDGRLAVFRFAEFKRHM